MRTIRKTTVKAQTMTRYPNCVYVKGDAEDPSNDIYFFISHGTDSSYAAIVCKPDGHSSLHPGESDTPYLRSIDQIQPLEPEASVDLDGKIFLRYIPSEEYGSEIEILRRLSEIPDVEFPLTPRDIYARPRFLRQRIEEMRGFLQEKDPVVRAKFEELFPKLRNTSRDLPEIIPHTMFTLLKNVGEN